MCVCVCVCVPLLQVLEERQNACIAGIVEEVFRRVGQGIMRNNVNLFTAPRYVGVCAWFDEGEHPSTGQQAWVSVCICMYTHMYMQWLLKLYTVFVSTHLRWWWWWWCVLPFTFSTLPGLAPLRLHPRSHPHIPTPDSCCPQLWGAETCIPGEHGCSHHH